MTARRLFQIRLAVRRGDRRAVAGRAVAASGDGPAARSRARGDLRVAGFALGLGYPDRIVLHMSRSSSSRRRSNWRSFIVPGRHARLIDFVVDAAAAVPGVGARDYAATCWAQLRRREQRRLEQPAEPDARREKQPEGKFQRAHRAAGPPRSGACRTPRWRRAPRSRSRSAIVSQSSHAPATPASFTSPSPMPSRPRKRR